MTRPYLRYDFKADRVVSTSLQTPRCHIVGKSIESITLDPGMPDAMTWLLIKIHMYAASKKVPVSPRHANGDCLTLLKK